MKKIGSYLREHMGSVFGIVLGFFCGLKGLSVVEGIGGSSASLGEKLISGGIVLLCLYTAYLLQVIVHEGGHLVAGLLSGYAFSSFRIGKWMWIVEKGKIRFAKFHIHGTGGQCIMFPPAYNAGDYPSRLYNFGGVLMNLVVTVLCFVLYSIVPTGGYVSAFLVLSGMVGLFIVVTNGIPLRIGGMANDGLNALSLARNQEANKAFWLQLFINGEISSGRRLKDMPAEWFAWNKAQCTGDPLVASIGYFRENYLLDLRDFEGAKELAEELLHGGIGLLSVYEMELRCDLLFLEIIGANRANTIEIFYTKDLQKYIQRVLPVYVSKIRLMYAYELLVRGDEVKADKYLVKFEKVAKTYPYRVEVESERELLALVKERWEQRRLEE